MYRIMIVDDDENNRAVAADALESDEYKISMAVDGRDCLRQVAEDPVDLILLDVMMPGIDGIETLRELKSDAATSQIAVIMVTALNMDSQVAACLDEGAIDHVSKPFSNMVLRARVRTALRSKANQASAAETMVQRGKVLAIAGAKGGVGTTTLAVNLAAKLVEVGKTAIVGELQPGAATSAVQLGLTPRRGESKLWNSEGFRITERTVEEHLLSHPSGVRILLGPPNMPSHQRLDGNDAGELIQALSSLAQFTILDVGSGEGPWQQELLRRAESILLVLEMDPCSLSAAQRRLASWAEIDIQPGAVTAVVNNRIHLPSPPTGLGAIRSDLECDIVGVIPADPEGCVAAVHQSVPLVQMRPDSVTAGALAALANRVGMNSLAPVHAGL